MPTFRAPLRRIALLLCVAFTWPDAGGAAASSSLADEASTESAGTRPQITNTGDFWLVPENAKSLPHTFELDLHLIYYDPFWKLLWAHDSNSQTYLTVDTTSPRLRSGQRYRFSGTLIPARGLPFATATITPLPDSPGPKPLSTRGAFGDARRFDGLLVTAEGYVNSQLETDPNHLSLDLSIEGHRATAQILIAADSPIPQVEGALVQVTGVYVAKGVGAAFQPELWLPDSSHLVITGWLDKDPRFELPVVSIEKLHDLPSTSWTHVIGEVQSQKPGEFVVIRDHTGQATLRTAMTRPLQIGSRIEAIGLPTQDGIETVLRDALYRIPDATILSKTDASAARGLPLLRLSQQVRTLAPDEAARGYAARLRGVVIWSHQTSRTIYLLDASGSIAVTLPPDLVTPPAAGFRLDVAGRSFRDGFAPGLQATSIHQLDSLPVPEPRPVSLEHALTGVEESQWISLTGFTREVRHHGAWSHLEIATSSGEFKVRVPRTERVDSFADAVVAVRGVCRALTDAEGQLTDIELWVNDPSDISIQEPRPADPFAAPLRPVASLRRFNSSNLFQQRVRVSGTVLHHQPGAYLVLQDEDQSLLVLTRGDSVAQPGERIEAVGFPGRDGARLVLRESLYRKTGDGAEPPAATLERPSLLKPRLDGRLVQIGATVVDVSRYAAGLRLACQADGMQFEALLDQFDPAQASVAPGSLVELRGVYVTEFNQDSRPRAFHLRLRSAADIAVLRSPSWWNARRTMTLAAALAFAILLGLGWVVALRRRVGQQTTQIREQLEKSARLEAELVRSSRLESLGVLAGGIAHDFNNLLTVILGNVSLVRSGASLGPDDEHCLRESERAGLRARDLTQQLLTFAKGGTPVRTAVLLPDIVREAAGFALHGSNVRCDFDFAPSLWPGHVDRGQISQVVHNIVINAMHAMPTGGIVRVTLRNEALADGACGTLPAGRYLHLSIRDSGTGISPDHLARIFDPYFTTKQQGSGLGLATVYSIVKKHGGHIDVESQLGRGTAFHIRLPAAERIAHDATASAPPTRRLHGRALVMDDEAPVREMAAAMLRRLGLDVTTTVDGREVVRAYSSALSAGERYSLVILDLTVPGAMGGKEAIAELLKIDPDVRAVVSSGYSNDPVIAHYREHGFRGCVPKPYEFDQFARTIAAIDDPVSASANPVAS